MALAYSFIVGNVFGEDPRLLGLAKQQVPQRCVANFLLEVINNVIPLCHEVEHPIVAVPV
eukprot:2303508-Lingulodinium_polyedra.AAC.1